MINCTTVDRLGRIEADFSNANMTIKTICQRHKLSAYTLYELADIHGWTERMAINGDPDRPRQIIKHGKLNMVPTWKGLGRELMLSSGLNSRDR